LPEGGPMSGNPEHPWLTVVGLLVGGVAFGITPLLLAWLWARVFSPNKPGAEKNATYECGLESKGDAWIQFGASYYLYAIVFLVFDVEAVFFAPVCGGIYGTFAGGVPGDAGVFAVAGRGVDLGLPEGRADVGVTASFQLLAFSC
jgi:NADH:ubiquinone oxidoreductase subunit 3 (subunit A)